MIWWAIGGLLALVGLLIGPHWLEVIELFDHWSPIPDRARRRHLIWRTLVARNLKVLAMFILSALFGGGVIGFVELTVRGKTDWWFGWYVGIVVLVVGIVVLLGIALLLASVRDSYCQHIWYLNLDPVVQQALSKRPREEIQAIYQQERHRQVEIEHH
jgi:hypothetical protein